MARSCSLWLPAVFTLFTVMVTLSSCTELTDSDFLKKTSRDLTLPSKCVMDCTRTTFWRPLEKDRRIHFTNSETDDLGNYCWSMPIGDGIEEHFQHAYIVLPVNESQGAGSLEVTLLPHNATLQLHHNHTLLPDSCGLPYDITAHFTSERGSPNLSVRVQIDPQQTILGNEVLRCPPFLVTQWQKRQNRLPANDGSG